MAGNSRALQQLSAYDYDASRAEASSSSPLQVSNGEDGLLVADSNVRQINETICIKTNSVV